MVGPRAHPAPGGCPRPGCPATHGMVASSAMPIAPRPRPFPHALRSGALLAALACAGWPPAPRTVLASRAPQTGRSDLRSPPRGPRTLQAGHAPTLDLPSREPLSALAADSAVILDDLRTLSSDAMEGRRTGTRGAVRARAFLEARLRAAGVHPLGDGHERAFTWTRPPEMAPHPGVNLVGSLAGDGAAGRFIVVSAHYDHLGIRNGQIYNGADDDASGAVGLLALARALRGHPLRHTLLFVEFDAEEEGLRGSRAFVADPPVPLARIALDLNLDMVSRTAGVLWVAGAHETPTLRPILEEVAALAPVALRLGHDRPEAPEGDDWTEQGDHGSFHDAGIPFVYLGVEDHPDYHRPTDDFERIDPGEYMNALRASLMMLLALDQALPLPAAAS